MDEKSKIEMNEFYSTRLKKYGVRPEALNFKTAEQQNKRFALLTDIEPISSKSSVLDVGCGLADLCAFLRKHGWKGKYAGIDINPDIINAVRKRFPEDDFFCLDILTDKFDEQYDYIFCAAAIQHRPKYSDTKGYLEEMVKKMFTLTKKGLVFDVFSNRVDYMDEDKLYVDPIYLLSFCYTLTNRVVLRNDFRPYEIMVYLYKETSKDSLNIYKMWVPSTPEII